MKTLSLLALVVSGPAVTGGPLAAREVARVVRPEFFNTVESEAVAVALFSGNVGAYAPPGASEAPAMPTSATSGWQLAESGFGQTFSARHPFPGFVVATLEDAQGLLYPPFGATQEQVEGSGAVFRYKTLLYGAPEGSSGVAARFERMDEWYGPTERAVFSEAVQLMRDALKFAPNDPLLQDSILDAFYDKMVAEAQLLKARQATLARYRLGLVALAPDELVIDREIEVHEELVAAFESSIAEYGSFLVDRMGVDLANIDSTVPAAMPLGAYLFRERQPMRNQLAARFFDPVDGILKTVGAYDPATGETVAGGERVLFAGYKDYVALVGQLRDYLRICADLARLYGMRGRVTTTTDDYAAAAALIDQGNRQAYLNQFLLDGILDGLESSPADASGAATARRALAAAMGDLEGVRAFLDGASNVLGYPDNFLVLIQEFPDNTAGNQFDSFDAFFRWIRSSDTAPLNFAATTFNDAVENYERYRGFADQLHTELERVNNAYADRYFAITGYHPTEPGEHLRAPLAGSELAAARAEKSLANSRVAGLRRLGRRISSDIVDANEAVLEARNRIDGITGALYDYQWTATSAWDEIAKWRAIQAGAQANYDAISDMAGLDGAATALTFGTNLAMVTLAGAANAGIQSFGSGHQAMMEGKLDLARAQFDAELALADSQIVVQQAEAAVGGLHREQIGASLELGDATGLVGQAAAREVALVREVLRLQAELAASESSLHDRYYADPLHFLRAQSSLIEADNAFRDAQRWVFFTARALEFKWNRPLEIAWAGRDWTISSLYRLRNFQELNRFVGAMEEFNRVNLINFNREPFVDRISLRNDVFAPALTSGLDDGERYDLGARELVTEKELFRRRLADFADSAGNLIIPLNTFSLRKDDGFFFLGPKYLPDGRVLSAGKYLDKIEWLKINLVGTFAPSVRDGNLSYGGTAYLRTQTPPCFDPANPTSRAGDVRSFPFYYFFTTDNGATWRMRRTQEDTVKLVISNTAGEPDRGVVNSTLENRFLKERSVAATNWVLTIPAGTVNLELLDDIEIYVRHQFVSREPPICD
jgi:hypothetical protein